MHNYTITDRATLESTSVLAPNRDAALKAYVKQRLVVARVPQKKAAAAKDEQWSQEELDRAARPGTPITSVPSGTDFVE